ncbi:MAG: hypothetical protein HC833_04400 [Leptolyngbyaceae cyanobacterium RM1_406_9]|nr:hypothetical protein [Leptolyngbyaceae cyanobacterium RM1_406_9]
MTANNMTANNDAMTAIESLEALLKAKIKLQDAQVEAQPMLQTVSLLFEPDPLNEDQKNILRNGLKNLRKLMEAHTAYGEAVTQAEPARSLVNQLFESQRKPTTNGKTDGKTTPVEEKATAK